MSLVILNKVKHFTVTSTVRSCQHFTQFDCLKRSQRKWWSTDSICSLWIVSNKHHISLEKMSCYKSNLIFLQCFFSTLNLSNLNKKNFSHVLINFLYLNPFCYSKSLGFGKLQTYQTSIFSLEKVIAKQLYEFLHDSTETAWGSTPSLFC